MKFIRSALCCTLLLLALCAASCTQPPALSNPEITVGEETASSTEASASTTEETEQENQTEASPVTEAETQVASEATSENATESQAETEAEADAETEAATEAETQAAPTYDLLVAKVGMRRSSFRVKFDPQAASPLNDEAEMVRAMIESCCGTTMLIQDASTTTDKEIILCDNSRPEGKALRETLEDGEFAIRVDATNGGSQAKIYLAATSYRGYVACAEYLLNNCSTAEDGLRIPSNVDVKGTEKDYTLITTTIDKLRDPFILVEDGVYYAYGTGWKCYKNTSGDLTGPWTSLGRVASVANPETDGKSRWAPEVYKYNGSYYMFTTYLNALTNHRGCTIMKSDSPEGPFVEITGGHITPKDWDAIDGTLYIDPDGQPWMVFVHEWTCMPDGVGSFAAAKLSADFTHFISEPIELFKAKEPYWATSGVTDGCWMYTTEEGELLMLWSNFSEFGYNVAVARSSNGRLDGEWIHEDQLLYSKYLTGIYDGGHAMTFTDTDGQMYLCFHSPNTADGDRQERPVFLAIKEEDGKLVWDEPQTAS